MNFPRIHLAIDNSFAAKRWTKPDEWAALIKSLGIECIEASADTEADPFYCGEEYLNEWIEEVKKACSANKVRVVNFFTGYTSYRTIGLAHPDRRIRNHIVNDWLGVMAKIAAKVKAGLGFYIHAFPESVLFDPGRFEDAKDGLYDTLAEVTRLAIDAGDVPIILEQMYSPHQIPWTIAGTLEYLEQLATRTKIPGYVAIDTGHQTGQHRFLRPSVNELEIRLEKDEPAPYLGVERLYDMYDSARKGERRGLKVAASNISGEMDKYPYLFASSVDCDLYRWLSDAGCYSPIIHLQQTNGKSSSHLPFTSVNNANGIVDPMSVLTAIAKSYENGEDKKMPPKVRDIYLTFEIFPHTSDTKREILSALGESVRYWRKWIPKDGALLTELIG
jgi:sugar phosphate isomerase/epimerase